MIGLLLRLISMGMIDTGALWIWCGGSICAICALCGLYKCSHLRLRDCSCIKWCMRATGADEFDDFEVMVIVHEVLFSAPMKRNTRIRLTAGQHQVQTNDTRTHIYQEALQLCIEQGTQALLVELIDGRTVLASLKLPITEAFYDSERCKIEQEHFLKPKCKGISNPKVKLTIHSETNLDAERGLLSNMKLSKGSEIILQRQLLKDPTFFANDEAAVVRQQSPMKTLAHGLKGNLEMFGFLGSSENVFVAIQGPPTQRRYMLCVYKDEKDAARCGVPVVEVDFLKIMSVQVDASRTDVFQIHYKDAQKRQQQLAFRRLDLPTETWVELLTKIISIIRQERDSHKNDKVLRKPR